jgi:uncharacterized protein
MQKTLEDIIGDPQFFLEELFSKISDIELKVDNYELDHICYRVQSLDEYKIKKEELKNFGELLVESIVNGRLISTFKLNDPILYKNRKIFLIELPAPKPMHSYPSGLEHAEFVTKEPLQKIIDRYPQYSFEAFGIHKKINADITLKLGNYCIRFHNQSLEEIIKMEKKLLNKR